jgi:hypothetical protein
VTGSRWPPHSAALLLSAELPSVAPAAHMRRILPSYNYFFFLWLAIVIITYILQKSFGRALRNALLMWAGGKRWRAERAPDTHNTETGDWTTAATFPRCRIYLSRSYKTDQETKKKKKKSQKTQTFVTDEIKHNPICLFWDCFQIPRALSLSLSLSTTDTASNVYLKYIMHGY